MKRLVIVSLSTLLLGLSQTTMAAGCIKGAVVGGVAGHVAGHHAIAGAVAGCVIGHPWRRRPRKSSSTVTPECSKALFKSEHDYLSASRPLTETTPRTTLETGLTQIFQTQSVSRPWAAPTASGMVVGAAHGRDINSPPTTQVINGVQGDLAAKL